MDSDSIPIRFAFDFDKSIFVYRFDSDSMPVLTFALFRIDSISIPTDFQTIRYPNRDFRFADSMQNHTIPSSYALAMLCDPDLAIARAKASQDHRSCGYVTQHGS